MFGLPGTPTTALTRLPSFGPTNRKRRALSWLALMFCAIASGAPSAQKHSETIANRLHAAHTLVFMFVAPGLRLTGNRLEP